MLGQGVPSTCAENLPLDLVKQRSLPDIGEPGEQLQRRTLDAKAGRGLVLMDDATIAGESLALKDDNTMVGRAMVEPARGRPTQGCDTLHRALCGNCG